MAFLQRKFLPSNDIYKTKTSAGNTLIKLYTWQRQRHAFRARRNGFLGGNFLFRISELTQRERICSFRKLQIFISQTTDSHFANYRFSFRKLQIFIAQTTDSHFANYRFPFRFVPFRFVPFRFVPFRFANYSKPRVSKC